jgi:uncharacterized protein (DUF433 family)
MILEETMNYLARFERNPRILNGEWAIKGTRVPVRTVLASLAEGASIEEILTDFPTLEREDVRAVIVYAAVAVEEDLPLAELPITL